MGNKVSPMLIAVVAFVVILVTITTMRLTGIGSNFANPVGNALEVVLSPVESFIWDTGSSIKGNFLAIFTFSKVKAENEELKKQVEKLTGDNLQLKQQVLAGLRYNELDKGKFASPVLDKYTKIGASLVNRDPIAWYQTVTLNKGSKDGIEINDPVVANLGLVGKVISTSSSNSDVLLILDGEGQVGALIRDSKGNAIFGTVKGTYRSGSRITATGSLEMDIKQEDEVNSGDLVLTSGLGGIYPKDIPVGVVEKVVLNSSGLYKTALISPIVNFDTLEEVYVVDTTGAK